MNAGLISVLLFTLTLASCRWFGCHSPLEARAPSPTPSEAERSAGCPQGMVALPGGSFTPTHHTDPVAVAPFCMDVIEVTVRDYSTCVKRGACRPAFATIADDQMDPRSSDFCNRDREDRHDHPVNCLDLDQAEIYCRSLQKRLPTEEEWEWAGRGADAGTLYPWGDREPEEDGAICWARASDDRGWKGTCPSASASGDRSPHGIRDLGGNVEEWTASRFATDRSEQVTRGGNWVTDSSDYLRVDERTATAPAGRSSGLGFRCVR